MRKVWVCMIFNSDSFKNVYLINRNSMEGRGHNKQRKTTHNSDVFFPVDLTFAYSEHKREAQEH